jgi:putative DNA primase/helicase
MNPETIEHTNMLDAALAYAERGWAVFPLAAGTKQPMAGSRGFKDASRDIEQITAWWNASPDANIGVPTGAINDITVFDVDMNPAKGKQGAATLLMLVQEHGALPPTLRQKTWSGGVQYIFAYNSDVPSRARIGGLLDIDTRNDGGYVVVPPSRVSEGTQHGTYAWTADLNTPRATMPDWLLERIIQTTLAAAQRGHRNPPGWADEKVHGVLEGSRDADCIRLLGRSAAMRPPLSKDEVLAFMLPWAANSLGHEGDPYPSDKVYEKVERLFEKYSTGELLRFPLSDAGNAERTIALHGKSFRWLTDKEEWLAWDGHRWAPGRADQVEWFALDAARQMQASAVRLLDAERAMDGMPAKDKAVMHALRAESAQAIRNAVGVARLLPDIQARSTDFDQDHDLLNVANGTLNLRTFTLQPHDPATRLTRLIPVAYEPSAQAPLWDRFLRDVFLGKQDVIDYVQRAAGYTLTGSIEEQCLFFLHGAGANGKSTFVAVLTALLGEYASKLEQEAILASDKNRGRGATPELMVLVGRRFAYVDELEEDRGLDEARVKALTGAEHSTGRGLYEGMCEWTNTAKVWLDLNHLPSFKGVDLGIERRLRVIPFDRQFTEQEQDKKMAEKLKAELTGILAWAVEGCRQ